ncbi:MAG: tetratricopeptide repeat protein [Candidatus Omnitrophota bacterium]
MKKLFLVFIVIFLAVVIFSGLGNDQYAIEKRFWGLQKRAEKVFTNPAASPPMELERVAGLFQAFIKKFPNNQLSLQSEFVIARLYMVKEEYDKARVQLKAVLDKYSKSQAICSEAVFLAGNSYEIEGKWGPALEQYKTIIKEYPLTLRGFSTPVYIAQHYKIKYQPDKMITAFQEAIAHYRQLADKYAGSPAAYQAEALIAQCYMALKDWPAAIAAFNATIEKFKGKVPGDGALLRIALIYKNELKDNVKAKQVLEQLIKDYPQSRFLKSAEALLKEAGGK